MEYHVTGNGFAEWIESLAESRWWLISIFLFSLAAGLGYLFVTTPIYLSDALLQIEEKERGMSSLGEVSEILQQDAIVSEKAKIVTSRAVLGKVVDEFALDIVSHPVHLPVLGRAIARWNHTGKYFREPWEIFDRFAWGGESLRIDAFEVPNEYFDEPFFLVTEAADTYGLYDRLNRHLGAGKVGAESVFTLADGGSIVLLVTGLKAHAGTHFELRRLSRLAAIETLRESLKVEESVRSPNAPLKSGLLRISREGDDARKTAAIVDATVKTYIAQNAAYKSNDIIKTLGFLKEQMDAVKTRMNQAENSLSRFQNRNGLVDLPREANILSDRLAGIEVKLSELRGEREELNQNFTEQHYRMTAIDLQIGSLEGEQEKLMQRMQKLPAMQQEFVTLSRDVDVNQHLYTLLLNKSHEFQVLKAGTTGDVRVLDNAAVPVKPVRPKKELVVMLSAVLGLLAGLGVAALRHRLNEVVRDPELVEQHLGLPVVAVVPNSKTQTRLIKKIGRPRGVPAVLARIESQDTAVESLRGLRTMLQLGRATKHDKVILITGPAPNVGKSFVAVNLATVLAGTGKRVLLIDADFRRGQINRLLGIDNSFGLSDLLTVDSGMNLPVRTTQIPNLNVLPTGRRPPNPSELLMQPRFGEVIAALSKQYDLVVIDSPPVLAVTDAAIIGKLASMTLLVVRAGSHHMREIEQSVKHLIRAGVQPDGVVFNGMTFSRSGYGYGRYYGYGYAVKP